MFVVFLVQVAAVEDLGKRFAKKPREADKRRTRFYKEHELLLGEINRRTNHRSFKDIFQTTSKTK